MFNSRDWGNRVHVYIFVLIIIAVGCHFKLLTSSTLLHDSSIYDINIWTCIYKRWTSASDREATTKKSKSKEFLSTFKSKFKDKFRDNR